MVIKLIVLAGVLMIITSFVIVFVLSALVKDLNERIEVLESEVEEINPKLS